MADDPQIDQTSHYARWMIIGLWLLVLGFGTWFAHRWLEARNAADPGRVLTGDNGALAVEFDADLLGHYLVAGEINGQAVEFLVDTGASQISIPAGLADRLGLERGQAQRAMTANGTVQVFATRLEQVSLGPLVRQGVRASINPGLEGDVALLGMSFLRDFELIQRNDRLIVRDPG